MATRRSPSRRLTPSAPPPSPVDIPSLDDGRWLHDERLLRLESERLFPDSWQLVGDQSLVPDSGSFVAVRIGNEPVVVVRDANGELSAFSNVCRHRGSRIVDGHGRGEALVCPYHGWSYGLDGRLHHDKSERLPRFALATVGPLIFVRVIERSGDESLATLIELGRPYADSAPAAMLTYDVQANWKLLVENFNECRHCGLVHRETLARRIDLESYRVEPCGNMAVHHIRSVPAAQLGSPVLTKQQEERRTYWLWPTTALSFLPEHLITFVVRPITAELSRVERIVYGAPGEVATSIADYLDEVMREDIVVVERVQQSSRSRFFPAPSLDPREEIGVKHFRDLFESRLATLLAESEQPL